MITIRPFEIFQIGDDFSDPAVIQVPSSRRGGSITSLESLMLVKLMRIVSACKVFEFGTYKGQTTRLLADNIPKKRSCETKKRVYTLDLETLAGVEFTQKQKKGIGDKEAELGEVEEEFLANEAIHWEREYLKSQNHHLVEQLLQNSLDLNEDKYLNLFQMIFIDGNHQIEYAKSDTEKSLKMLAEAPSVIVWHDYQHPNFKPLTSYLERLSTGPLEPMFHVEETSLVLYFSGNFRIR
jgi:predicted O-methyltransferase YrrM